MVYATLDDVKSRMAHFSIDTNTKPSTSQVTAILATVESRVNNLLRRRGVVIPLGITDSAVDFKLVLLDIVSDEVTATVLKSMFPDATGPGETPAWTFYDSRARAGFKGLDDGSLIPVDLTGDPGGGDVPSTYFTRNPSQEEDFGEDDKPWFTHDKQF